MDYKERVLAALFSIFERENKNNGIKINYKIRELNNAIQHVDSLTDEIPPNTVLSDAASPSAEFHGFVHNLYQHDEAFCPNGFKWCWCGLFNTIEEYNGLKREDKLAQSPRVMIDCRPYEQRPFETRNCRPILNDTLIDAKEPPFIDSKIKMPCGTFF